DPRDLHSFPTRRSSDLRSCAWLTSCPSEPGSAAGRVANLRRRARLAMVALGGGQTMNRYFAAIFAALAVFAASAAHAQQPVKIRSEEHTSELQSLRHLV